jgi:hypothetical protein
MGESEEGIKPNGDSEDDALGSGEAHHVACRPQEDRGVPEGKVGKGQGGAEEGCLVPGSLLRVRGRLSR